MKTPTSTTKVATALQLKLPSKSFANTNPSRRTFASYWGHKSMYTDLISHSQPFHHKYIWKLKVPLKKKIMWCLDRKDILMKDKLEKMELAELHKMLFGVLAKLLYRIVHVGFRFTTSWKNKYVWEFVLYCRPYGILVIIVFLTWRKFLIFDPIFTDRRIRMSHDLSVQPMLTWQKFLIFSPIFTGRRIRMSMISRCNLC